MSAAGIKDSLSYLSGFSKPGAPVKDLSRFSRLMEELGNPQRGMKCFHIAGTNGKGSVASYMAAALEECGYSTGKFISPFIVNIRERISINGEYIPEQDFESLCLKTKEAVERCSDRNFSQFEILTAVCFLYFREKNADFVVLETGIGGELDCTNVIDKPAAAVITSIGIDHSLILGNTEREIARSKSGIIKGGFTVAANGISKEAMEEIRNKCLKTGAELHIPSIEEAKIVSSDLSGNTFYYKGIIYHTSMCGTHQINNCITALEALSAVRGLDFKKAAPGISKAKEPARLEFINEKVIIDGGHNVQAAKAAREVLTREKRRKNALIGIINTKDYEGVLKELLPCFESMVFCEGYANNAVSAKKLYETAVKLGLKPENGYFAENVKTALTIALEITDSETLLFCGGSLYLASEIRRYFVDNS